jgi:hypothetical protein
MGFSAAISYRKPTRLDAERAVSARAQGRMSLKSWARARGVQYRPLREMIREIEEG